MKMQHSSSNRSSRSSSSNGSKNTAAHAAAAASESVKMVLQPSAAATRSRRMQTPLVAANHRANNNPSSSSTNRNSSTSSSSNSSICCRLSWKYRAHMPSVPPRALLLLLLLLQPLLLQQQQLASAIVCEIDAREGLEAAIASAAAAAAERQQMIRMLPLCRVPYLVNSQLPPKDVPHVGMEKGGVVTIDLQLLPGDYKNSMPSTAPRFARAPRLLPAAAVASAAASAAGSPEANSAAAEDSSYAAYKEHQQKQRQPPFRYAEERHSSSSNSSSSSSSSNSSSSSSSREGDVASRSTSMLLHMDAADEPLAALASTFPLLVHAGRRLSYFFSSQQQEQQEQEQQQQQEEEPQQQDEPSPAANTIMPALLLSSLSSSFSQPRAAAAGAAAAAPAAAANDQASSAPAPAAEAAAAAAAAAAAEASAAEASGAPASRLERRRDCNKQIQRGPLGCPDWNGEETNPPAAEAAGTADAAEARQLSPAEGEELEGLVNTVNNTFLLLLDHAQLYFLDTHESWLPSFTAEDGLVLNSYVPSMLRVPFTGPRLQLSFSLPRKDRYALLLLNADSVDLKLQGFVSFYNPNQQHLSLDQQYLPQTTAFLMALNLLAALVLCGCQLSWWRGRNLFVCLLFICNFFLTALAFGLDWRQAAAVQASGKRPAALWVASRLMRKLQDVVQLLVFIFVSLGFRIVRPTLTRLEVQFIAGLAVISLYLGIFEVLLGGFQETRYIFHAAGYVRVLIAVHSNIVLLHNQIADSTLSPAVAEYYPKLAAYQRFRWLFFGFLLKPVFSVFFKVTFLGPIYEQLLSWDEWVYVLFDNLADFAVLAALCWDFCPPKKFKVLEQLSPREDEIEMPAPVELE